MKHPDFGRKSGSGKLGKPKATYFDVENVITNQPKAGELSHPADAVIIAVPKVLPTSPNSSGEQA
jgi:hypothetical protein